MILDLFAGPGGWSEGLRSIGLHDIGLEWDHNACRTRIAAGHRTVRTDVAQYPTEPFVGKVRGLIASPPCQAFSMAGKRLGMQDLQSIHRAIERCRGGWTDEALAGPWADARSPLILQPLRWAWATRPTWIACEQVPPARGVWEHMADVLRSWGYDARALKLNSADYGVPQTRERAFLLAHRERVHVAEPTHAQTPQAGLFGVRLPWVSMAAALGWTEGSRSLDRRYGGYAADAAPLADAAPSPTLSLSKGREVWRLNRPAPTPSLSGSTSPVGGSGSARAWEEAFAHPERWPFERPSTHIQGDPRVGRPGHKDRESGESQFEQGACRITQEEAATLQGFPADYPFQGTKTSRFRQIGNAVPPTWAAHIIGALDGGYP